MDPYKVLGISRDASDEEIKRAYRELVKKYHPDKHQNNPLGELAEDKLREINEAYDSLQGNRNGKGTTSSSANYQYMEIRRDIDTGRLKDAEKKLANIQNRDAEWFFLRGMVSYRKGWYDDAVSNIQNAAALDPNNREYSTALNRIMNSGNGYRNDAYGGGYRSNDDMMCKLCQCYICADCCCDCI